MSALDCPHPEDYGTLETLQSNSWEFCGANEHAFIDSDGVLCGLPPFDVLQEGVVVCLSPQMDKCFYIFCSSRWPDFAVQLEEELASCDGQGVDQDDGRITAQMRRIVEEGPYHEPFDKGLVQIPPCILDESGVGSGVQVTVVGNSGYFEVWDKAARDELCSAIGLSLR